ncbi:MAG: BlaI/MecI/CopY family transcriptional regulator [Saprospiraceae bacterium]|nr:BlaI/MecI/CopY family transcriptional regulator [Saprospiraceae bacterium]
MEKLNHKEEEIMRILWELRKGFVKEILERMVEPKPPYNTVSSIVRKLESMGLVGHDAFGKTHRYYPILQKENYRKYSFQSFMQNYFGGSPSQLLSYFVKEEKLSPEEINQLLNELKKEA